MCLSVTHVHCVCLQIDAHLSSSDCHWDESWLQQSPFFVQASNTNMSEASGLHESDWGRHISHSAASSRYLPDGCRTAELCGSQHHSTRSVSATRCVCIKNGAWKIQSSLFIKSCPLLLDGWGTPSSSLAPQWIGMGNMDTPSSSAPS